MGEDEGRSLAENGEERVDEGGEDAVDGGEKGVCADFCAPVLEDGVGGFEDAEVDGVVRRGEGGDELLEGGLDALVELNERRMEGWTHVDKSVPSLGKVERSDGRDRLGDLHPQRTVCRPR